MKWCLVCLSQSYGVSDFLFITLYSEYYHVWLFPTRTECWLNSSLWDLYKLSLAERDRVDQKQTEFCTLEVQILNSSPQNPELPSEVTQNFLRCDFL